nr:hypothetical protein [Tanacetum cinerariifolium]
MLVLAAKEVGQAQDDASIPTEPSTSNPHKKHKSKKQQPKAPKVPSPEPSPEHQLPSPSNDPIPTAKDSLKLQELMDLHTRLSNKVLDLESEVIDIKSSFIDKIKKLEDRGRMIADMDEDVEVNLEEAQAKVYNLDLQHLKKVLSIQDMDEEEPAEVEEVLEVVTAAKLITEVVTTTTAAQVPKDIDEEELVEVEEVLKVVTATKLITEVVTNAEPTTTTAAQVPKVSAPRRRRGVVIQDPEETASLVIVHTEVQSKDKGKGILIEEPKPLKGQEQIEQDEGFLRQLEAELNANINWNDVMEKVKRSERQNNAVMRNDHSQIRPLFEKHYNLIQAFLKKVEEEVTIQEKEIKEE